MVDEVEVVGKNMVDDVANDLADLVFLLLGCADVVEIDGVAKEMPVEFVRT